MLQCARLGTVVSVLLKHCPGNAHLWRSSICLVLSLRVDKTANSIGAKGTIALLPVLSQLKQLKTLDLGCSLSFRIDCCQGIRLVEVLVLLFSERFLFLLKCCIWSVSSYCEWSECGMGSEGAAALFRRLPALKNLRVLWLGGKKLLVLCDREANEIDDSAIAFLTEAAPSSSSISTVEECLLMFADNRIGKRGCVALCAALLTFSSLQVFWIQCLSFWVLIDLKDNSIESIDSLKVLAAFHPSLVEICVDI